MAERIHLRALLAGIAARHLVGVEGMARARDADRRLGVLAQRHRERRLRHGVRAHIRQLVGLRVADWRDAARSAARWRGRACSPCRSRRRPATVDGSAPERRESRQRERTRMSGRKPNASWSPPLSGSSLTPALIFIIARLRAASNRPRCHSGRAKREPESSACRIGGLTCEVWMPACGGMTAGQSSATRIVCGAGYAVVREIRGAERRKAQPTPRS